MQLNHHPRLRTRLSHCVYTPLFALLLLTLTACQPYEITGLVVPARGEPAGVRIVSKSDSRLDQTGLEAATVILTLDPDSLRPIRLGSVTTDHTGRFRMPVDELGAGLLEYELGIYARAKGYAPTWQKLPLPGGSKRLVVLMRPGQDRDVQPTDILDETLQMIPPEERPDFNRR